MLAFVMSADAQDWALPSSRWQYRTSGCGFMGPCYDYFSDDLQVDSTLFFNGHSCNRVRYYFNTYPHDFYTYASGDTAYFYVNSEFRPIFYFGAHVGDTIQFTIDTGSHNSYHDDWQCNGVIDSINYIIFQSDTLKRISVTAIGHYQNSWRFEYAEKIGLLRSYGNLFYPGRPLVDGDNIYLCNYGDSTLPNYWFFPDSACADTHVGIQGSVLKSDFLTCSPNPASGTFIVDMSAYPFGLKQLHVYDALGLIVYSGESGQSQETLDLHLAGGMYTVEICENSRYHRGKVIIE
ncbi:MAG: hypothetical protein JWO03_2440 [Bacteroidetes bacterium]|nr:hypothetical protein [Bacteroidota bacterium]